MSKRETLEDRGISKDQTYLTLSDLIFHLSLKNDDGARYHFTRKFFIECWTYSSLDEIKKDVSFLNFKGRLNNLKDGYQGGTSDRLHSDHIAASDWCYILFDEEHSVMKATPITIKQAEILAKKRRDGVANSLEFVMMD
ncbi:hypothetical protein N9948_02120 [bacterium]|nr:hypothetical protein [bacterium]